MKTLNARIGELTLKIIFRRGAHQGRIAARKMMIDRTRTLFLTKHAEVSRISRGSIYSRPRPVSDTDLGLMHRVDKLHLDHLFAGSRL